MKKIMQLSQNLLITRPVLSRHLNLSSKLNPRLGDYKAVPLHIFLVSNRCISTAHRDCLPLPPLEEVKVSSFQAITSNEPVETSESWPGGFLTVNDTHFWSAAIVNIPPVPRGEEWHVGYIQALENANYRYRYGNLGVLQGVMPELTTGLYPMINDSTGVDYPWYDFDTVEKRVGPCARKEVELSMDDNPRSVIATDAWYLLSRNISWFRYIFEIFPLSLLFGKVERQPLTFVAISIDFYTWLVMRCANTGEMHILRTVKWNVDLFLKYNSNKKSGDRVSVLAGKDVQDDPEILERDHVPIPDSVLGPPAANDAVGHVWEYCDRKRGRKLIRAPNCRPDLVVS